MPTAAVDAICTLCGGVGLIRKDGVSKRCECQDAKELAIRLRNLRLPPAYEAASLENFEPTAGNGKALFTARQFIKEYTPLRMASEGPQGLLLTGSVGTGKTHLASALARQLVASMGIRGRFQDCRELYDRLKASYDDDSRENQKAILADLVRMDLLVLDELGAVRPSDWVFEVTELLIGMLYNNRKLLIATSNFPNSPAGGQVGSTYNRLSVETLGDRIGARMWSRLQEMCVAVDMTGPDWRTKHRE